MKDENYIPEEINQLANLILNTGSHNKKNAIYSIPEQEEAPNIEFNDCITLTLEPEIYHQVLLNPSEHYERFKYLLLKLYFLTSSDDINTLNQLNYNLKFHATDVRKNIINAPEMPSKTKSKLYLDTLVKCYLYQLVLEKIHHKYLGLVDDPILNKLFSQGTNLWYLSVMCFQHSEIINQLHNIGVPLGVADNNYLKKLQKEKPCSYSRIWSKFTNDYNLLRLGIIRLRRLFLTLSAFNFFNDLALWTKYIDPNVGIVLRIINLIYFMPRLTLNLIIFSKHLWLTSKMTAEEKSVGLFQRLICQWNRRWETILRDLLWFSNGLISFTILIGPWAIYALPMNAVVQSMEVLLNLYLYYEFIAQKTRHEDFFASDAISQKNFLTEQKYRLSLEEQNRFSRLINSILLLVSNILVCSFFLSISPYIPLVGAIIGVIMTSIQLYCRYNWEKEKDLLQEPFALPKHFFQQSTKAADNLQSNNKLFFA